MKLHTRILNGKIPQYSRNEIKNFLEKNEGKEISIEIKKISYQRSNPQNKFYWGVWIPIIQQALSELSGELVSIEETHNIIKINCNYKEIVNENTGEIARRTKSTSELSTAEWEQEFKPRIQKWALDFLNITLPEPNEQLNFNF